MAPFRGIKTINTFQTTSPKSGYCRLGEVAAYKSSNYSDLTGIILVFWESGRLQEVVAQGNLTVFLFKLINLKRHQNNPSGGHFKFNYTY